MYAEIATDTSQQTLYCPPGLKNTAFSFSSITVFSFSSIKCTIDLLHLLPLPNHFTWYPGQEYTTRTLLIKVRLNQPDKRRHSPHHRLSPHYQSIHLAP